MNKRGFTLIEILAVLLIMAFIGGIGVIGFKSFSKTAEERYYETLESNILLAGNDYYTDHRGELPTESNYSEVTLANLIEAKYVEPIKDASGKYCTEGVVYAYRENNKYKYEACLINCGEYSSTGKYCGEKISRVIEVSAKKKNSNTSYNVLRSYQATEYSDNEDIVVTLSMNSEYNIDHFSAVNTNGNVSLNCDVGNDGLCTMEINTSGSYKVTAYDEDGKEVSTRYINVKIARGGSGFSLSGDTKYVINKQECSNDVNTKTIRIDINKDLLGEEYKSIEYRINDGNYQEINKLFIETALESGHYDVDVVVTNAADNTSIQTISFDIVYPIDIEYDDDHTTGTHEVVKGQNYNYLTTLPETKFAYGADLNIRWYKDNVLFSPTDEVTDNCTFKIVGKTAVPVEIVDFTTYCKDNIKYTGSEQVLTKTPPTGVTFVNNKGINADDYTVSAHLASAEYIWSDGTLTDIDFTCSIGIATSNLALSSASGTLTYGTDGTVTATTSSTGTITCSTSDSSVATCSVNNKTITVTPKANSTDGKTATITVSQGATSNYAAGTANYAVTVNRKTISASLCPSTGTEVEFTGSPLSSGIDCPAGSTPSGNTATSIGSYTQTCVPNAGYKFASTCAVGWTISKRTATGSVSISGTTTWGDTLTANVTTNSDGTKRYQWYYNNSNSTSGGTAISGATSSTYTIDSAYVDKYIYVRVTIDESSTYKPLSATYGNPIGQTLKKNFSCTTSKGNYAYAGTIGSPSVSTNPGSGTVTYYRNTSNSTSGGTAWNGTTNTTLSPGTYYIYATIAASATYNAATCSAGSFTVSKGTVTCSTSKDNYTYGGTIGSPSVSSNPGSGSVTYYRNTSNSTSGGTAWSGTTSTTLNAGTYYIYATIAATTNYNAATCSAGSFTVNKANFTCSASKGNYTYAGTIGSPSVSNNPGSGTVTYYRNTSNSTSGGTAWSGTTSTTLNAGTYYIYATIAATTNYNAATCSAGSFTVSKASFSCTTSKGNYTYAGTIGSPSVSSNPGSGTVTYYRNTSNSTSGGTAWSGTTSTTLNAGTYYIYATVAATTNYNAATCSVGSFTVSKANVSCSTSKGNYTYAGTIGSPSVSSNPGGGTVTYYRNTSNSTSGGTAWSGTTSTTLNAGTYYIYATVAATTNYNASTCTTGSFTVSKASFSCSTSKGNYTYAGTIGSPSVSSNPGSGTVTYYRNASNSTSGGTAWSGTTSSTLNVGTYYIYATIAATTNYNAATCSTGSFTVSKGTCNAPTGVSISSAGKVTWTASSNCSGFQHQISINNSSWSNASSGVDYKSTIIGATGTRTVYVRASGNSNMNTSSNGTASTTVYSVALTAGTGVGTVSGAGNYINGSTATISAVVATGYAWKNWTGTSTLTANSNNVTVNGNKSYTANATANTYTIVYNKVRSGAWNTMNNTTCTYNQDCQTTQNNFSAGDNYDFRGWSLDQNTINIYGTRYDTQHFGTVGTVVGGGMQGGVPEVGKWYYAFFCAKGPGQLTFKVYPSGRDANATYESSWGLSGTGTGQISISFKPTTDYELYYVKWKVTAFTGGSGATYYINIDSDSTTNYVKNLFVFKLGSESSVVIPNGAVVRNLTATNGATVNLYAIWNYVLSNGKKENGQGCTSACFTSGTPVFTSEGYKKIEDVKIGDKVLSYNETKKVNEYKEVTDTYVHEDVEDELYEIEIGYKTIKVTPDHRFYISRNNEEMWVPTKELKVGDRVMYMDQTFHKIHDIRHYLKKNTVYNFAVKDNHNYYVGEEGILVHNDKGVDAGGTSGQAAYTCRMYYTRSSKTVSIGGVPQSTIMSSYIYGPGMAGYYTSSTVISQTGTYSGKVWWSGGQTATCSVTVNSL